MSARWRFERCKAFACGGRRNCVGFTVSDEDWAAVVPAPLRSSVVCIECFDEMAQAAGHRYEVLALYHVSWHS